MIICPSLHINPLIRSRRHRAEQDKTNSVIANPHAILSCNHLSRHNLRRWSVTEFSSYFCSCLLAPTELLLPPSAPHRLSPAPPACQPAAPTVTSTNYSRRRSISRHAALPATLRHFLQLNCQITLIQFAQLHVERGREALGLSFSSTP